ncbi:MAG: calcium-binding protein [Alphaproteobacteria bacterium]|nr:MAG: calcium-binding protein [Alphaproteobacteria bacterium]
MRLLLTTMALLAATAAAAQTPPTDAAGMAEARAKLVAADTNKDGKWDKDEWLAAGRREMGFRMLDADKDGFVTQPELKTGMDRMRAMQGSPN